MFQIKPKNTAYKAWKIPASMAAISISATFLVGGYEFVRTISTSLFIDAYGSAKLPYAMTAIPVTLALLIYCYGRVLSRWGALRTLMASMLFSMLVFMACYLALESGSKAATVVFYTYGQIYIVVLIEQFWSLINSTLKPHQARIFNGPIIGGASIGPIVAGYAINRLAVAVGTEQFILLAAAALVPAALLAYTAYRLAGEPQPSTAERGGIMGHVNLRLFTGSRTLLLLAVVVGITQIVSTVLSLRFYGLVEFSIITKDARTAYIGGFWALTNAACFVLQFIVTPMVLRWVPLRWMHFGIPFVHIISCAVMFMFPGLRTAAIAFLLFKSFDYSLFRASKEILYIPLSYDARYRAKQVIDAFTYRFSKGATAGLLSIVTAAAGSIPGAVYPLIACFSSLAWAGFAIPLTSDRTTSPER